LQHADLKAVRLSSKGQGGGGNNISDEYRAIQERADEICLCIVDGDITYPGGSWGSTASQAIREDDGDVPFCMIYKIPRRELENVAPEVVLVRLANEGYSSQDALDFWKLMLSEVDAKAPLHFDLKKGLRMYQIDPSHSNSQETHYWRWVVDSLKRSGATVNTGCQNAACASKTRCECPVINGFGSHVLWRFINTPLHELDGHLDCVALEIGRIVAEWCLGGRKRFAY
jgi:hypothetical protein